LGIPERRYAKETLCAQICINSFTREKISQFARTRYEDLINFFSEYADPQGADRALFQEETRAIPYVLDRLWDCFGRDAEELKNRSYILSIYLFVEEYDPPNSEQKLFANFVFSLWKRLKEEAGLGMDRKNRELYSFQSYLSSAPGEAYQIEGRHKKLHEYYEFYKLRRRIKGD
jgi:hypothetical protein